MSPPDLLQNYLARIEQAVDQLPSYPELYAQELLTRERANLRLRLRFETDHLLEVSEAVFIEKNELKTLGYRYHFQNPSGQLIFRYDNTPHFPDLSSFPHHKHQVDNVVAAHRPDLWDVFIEAQTHL